MAKFYISNTPISNKLLSKNKGFKTVGEEHKENGLYSICFNKEVDNKCNCLITNDSANGGGYFYLVGSYILDEIGIEGKEEIEAVYDAYTSHGVEFLKQHVIGMWAACVVENGNAKIFNDYYGLYDVCYYNHDHTFCVGNALGDVQEILEDKTAYNEYAFIQEAFHLGAFSGETIFRDINKLKRDEYIEFSSDEFHVNRLKLFDIKYKYETEEKAVTDIAHMLKKYAQKVADKYHVVNIFLTGGLDSRLIFGALNATTSSIECNYGIGQFTAPEDKIIAENISSTYHKRFNLLDWKPSKNTSEQDIQIFNSIDYGNYVNGGLVKHINGFKNCSARASFYAFGYFCEAIRLREWVSNKGKTWSLDDFIDNYYINNSIKNVYSNYPFFREYVRNKFVSQLNSLGFAGDYNNIPVDYFERFRWIMARICDSRVEFMLNNFSFAFSLMSVPYIHEAVLSLPANVIKGGIFQIKVINELDSKLISKFDVFSHRRAFKITKDFNKVRVLTMKNLADIIFQILPFMAPILKTIYKQRHYKLKGNDKRQLKDLEQYRLIYPSFIDIEKYSGDKTKLKSLFIGIQRP